MKNFIILISLIFTLTGVNAQITKGNWLMGGSANFSSGKSDLFDTPTDYINLQISPIAGFFLLDKFAAGIKPAYEYSKYTLGLTTATASHFHIGPFVRYYFLKTEKQINILAEADYSKIIGLANGSNRTIINNYSLIAGPVVYFNSSVGLEFTVGYSYSKEKSAEGDDNKFMVGLGFQVHLDKYHNN